MASRWIVLNKAGRVTVMTPQMNCLNFVSIFICANVTNQCNLEKEHSLGMRTAGNMRTLARIKDRFGSAEITLLASALSSSSWTDFLL